MKNEKATTTKMARQRRFMLLLPLLVLPFITLFFWALGGGKMRKAAAQNKQTGFNLELPDTDLKDDKAMDKMSYYEQAKLDSVKFQELVKNDPNYHNLHSSDTDDERMAQPSPGTSLNTSLYDDKASNNPHTEKIYSQLDALNKELNKPVSGSVMNDENTPIITRSINDTTIGTNDGKGLEQMMQTMNQPEGSDPEMQQLNGMLEKILDIQHPDRIQEQLKQSSETNKGQLFAVSSKTNDNLISLLDNKQIENNLTNGFYSLEDTTAAQEVQNVIQAVVHETQTMIDGSVVKLRLVNDVFINGFQIPKGNFLFGTASLNGERLAIKINSIRYNNNLFPVELSVYDLDGMAGIYIPGAITRDEAKQSADRAIQSVGLSTLDPSLGAQAASAGIETARSLLNKKVKQVKVTVKAGYQVLLEDEKQKQ